MEKLAKVYDSGKVLNIANYTHMYVFEWNGKLLTVGAIREYFAKVSGADFTEPVTTGIFVSIAAGAGFQRKYDKTFIGVF